MKPFTREKIEWMLAISKQLLIETISPAHRLDVSPEREIVRLASAALRTETVAEFQKAELELRNYVESVRSGSDPLRSRKGYAQLVREGA